MQSKVSMWYALGGCRVKWEERANFCDICEVRGKGMVWVWIYELRLRLRLSSVSLSSGFVEA